MSEGKWIQKAVERMKRKGTQGSLTRIAKREGAYGPEGINKAWLEKKAKLNTAVGRKARFALAMRKIGKGK